MKSEKSLTLDILDKENITPYSKNDVISKEGIMVYIKNIITLAVPNTLSGALWNVQSFICIYFVGLLNDVKLLDGFSLGFTWASVFGFSIILGFSSALDTFISQFYGSKNYKECGIMLNRAFVIVGLATIPCIFLQFMSIKMFLLFGIDEKVSEYSYKSALALIPSIILYVPHVVLEKFLLNQQISNPEMILQLINTLGCPFFCYLFVFTLDMGLYGVMIVRGITEVIYCLGMILYIKFSHAVDKSLIAPSINVFENWWNYMTIAFPSLVMTCFEWWAFEIMNLFTGKIGVAALAANVISINYTNLIYLSCLGIGLATGTLVGNSVGEQNASKAKIYSILGVCITCILILFIDFFILFFNNFLSRLFTTDEEVIQLVKTMLYVVALFEISDGNQVILAKTLIAIGRQKYASILNASSYYLIMIPVGIVAAFTFGWGLYGVWVGIVLASFILCLGYTLILLKSDWDKIIQESIQRNRANSVSSVNN